MANDRPRDGLRTAWQGQSLREESVNVDELGQRARRFHKSIQWRNLREYAAALLVVAMFSYFIVVYEDPWMRIGSLLSIGGVLYVVCQLHKRGPARTIPAGMSSVEFHLRELKRQRDNLQTVWRWYMRPMIPGIVVFDIALAMKHPWGPLVCLSLMAAILVATSVFVYMLNQWGARKLQREIEDLSELLYDR